MVLPGVLPVPIPPTGATHASTRSHAAPSRVGRLIPAHRPPPRDLPPLWKLLIHRLRAKLWHAVCWLFEEFEPWLKWMLFDAILAFITSLILRRFKRLRPIAFEADWEDSSVCTTLWQWRNALSRLYPTGQEPGFLALEGLSVQVETSLPLGDSPPEHARALTHTHPCGDSGEDLEVDESALGTCLSARKGPAARGSAAGEREGSAGAGDRYSVVESDRSVATVTAVCDYHIVYHRSFNVPVMCVLARHIDGRPLPWQEFVSCLPAEQRAAAESPAARWSMITQQDHPVLQCPCFILHPCQTAELLDLMLPSRRHPTAASATGSQPDGNAASHTCGSTADVESVQCGGGGQQTEEQRGGDEHLWQLQRYMRAWWSLVGPAVGLPQLWR